MRKLLLSLLGTTFFLFQAGNAQELPQSNSKDPWGTFLYSFQTLDGGYRAVGSDGNHFYPARWLSADITRHDMDGSNPQTFTIPGVGAFRDITYDGNYFYAVCSSPIIYKLDLVNRVLVSQVTSQLQAALQHISFDPNLDGGNGGFWIGDNPNLHTVSMTGALLATHYTSAPTSFYFYGSAYDPYSDPAHPCVWLMTQNVTGGAILRQFDIGSNVFTSFIYNFGDNHPECSGSAGGGLCSYIDNNQKFCLAADVQTEINTILIYALKDLMNPDVPGPVTALTATAGASGALTATLNWTNPNQTHNGQPLTALSAIKIYEGTTLIHTISNPAIGQPANYTATVSDVGFHTFTVVPENTHGTGTATNVTTSWIGHDVPAAPQNPELVVTNSVENESWTVTASWTAPSQGLHGGYFTTENLTYDVFRMPENILVAESQNATTFTEPITEAGSYYYTIRAKNAIGEGGAVNTPELDLCWSVLDFPWMESFTNTLFPPTCWKSYKVQGTIDWTRGGSSTAFSPPGHAQLWSYDNGFRDVWLVTPAISLPETGNFVLEFQSRVYLTENYGSSEIWVSTETNDPNSNSFTMLKQLVSGVDFSTNDWKQIVVSLEEYLGSTVYIGFRYFKETHFGTEHYGWFIDDVTVKDIPDVEACAKTLYGALTPMVGEPFLYKATIENKGAMPLNEYMVKLMDGNNNVLAVNTNPPAIPVGETIMVSINWIPTTAGALTLYALVEAVGDADPTNNSTQSIAATVQPFDDLFEGNIGAGEAWEMLVPFCVFRRFSVAQSLHFDHEIIGRGGSIIQVQYYNNFSAPLNHPVQIWMANTLLNRLDQWLPQSEFTLVFEGEVEFPAGQNTITIELDNPYIYTGNNIVIMTNPVGPVNSMPSQKQFKITNTPDFQNRTRFYFDDNYEFNWTQPGSPVNFHANVRLSIARENMGSVSGTVLDENANPLEGVAVKIVGTDFQRTTDENGAYSFDFLLEGDYQFKASKHGYIDATSEVISVIADENEVVNFTLFQTPTFTLSGKVTGNDAPSGLADVLITLSGYNTYTTTTDANGDYLFPAVFDGYTYSITAEVAGYQTYASTVEINGANVTRNILLNEVPYSVVMLLAEKVEDNVLVTWGAPGSGTTKTFRYDSGNNNGQVGWGNETRNSIIGAAHREVVAELYNMSWYSTSNTVQPFYDLWVLGINDEGMPDRGNVLFNARNIDNIPNQWCNYEFPYPVVTQNGFFMGVSPSYGGFLSIGTASVNAEYPFVPNGNLSSFSPDDEWECFSVDNFYVNAMIRAEGTIFGKSVSPESKGFFNYKVYRLLLGQETTPALWTALSLNYNETTYTDTDWMDLDAGEYRYAVIAEYTDGVPSVTRFSNSLPKDMEVLYTVNLTTNSGDPVTDALLTLTNQDENPDHIYEVRADSETIVFPTVWKGTYNISITLDGYHPFSESNISINQEGLTQGVELIEIIVKPFFLKIEETGNAGERLLSWNTPVSTTYILDDGTGEDGFNINPGADVSLGNKFVVGESGWLTSVDIYGFHNLFTDIFGSRGVTVDIYNENMQLVGKSAPFYIASDNWGNVPLNNIPYSGTFYVMVHWTALSNLPTNFMGADYDGPNANRDLDMLFDGESWYIAHLAFQDLPFVFMIRANAESTGPAKSVTYGNKPTAKLTGSAHRHFTDIFNRMENPVSVNTEPLYEEMSKSRVALGFNVYLNNEEKAHGISEIEFLFSDLAKGTYTAGVTSLYSSGESEMRTIDFEVKEGNSIGKNTLENVVLFPNPFTHEIHISHPELVKNIRITDMMGKTINNVIYNGKFLSAENLSNGVYFVELESISGDKVIQKMVKK